MKIVSFFTIIFLFFSSTQIVNAQFRDVNTSHENAKAIEYIFEKEIAKGYSDGSFRPESFVNRAEFTKILLETKNIPLTTKANCFTDVSQQWFSPYVCTAKENKIIQGYPGNIFSPQKHITISEAAKIINEIYNFTTNKTSNSVWYAKHLRNLSDKKALPSSITSPQKKLTRGEMAEIIYRLETDIEPETFANYKEDKDIFTIEEYKKEESQLPNKDTQIPEISPPPTEIQKQEENFEELTNPPQPTIQYDSNDLVLLTAQIDTRPVRINTLIVEFVINLGPELEANQQEVELSELFDNLRIVQYREITPNKMEIVARQNISDDSIINFSNGQRSFSVFVEIDDTFIVPDANIDPLSVQKERVYWDFVVDIKRKKGDIRFDNTNIQLRFDPQKNIIDAQYLR